MSPISFIWSSPTALADELRRPLGKISVGLFQPHGWIMSVTLWRTDGSGLRMQSVMHSVAERREVGVLSFTPVLTPTEKERILEVGKEFSGQNELFKLTMIESGTCIESGVMLRGSDGGEIVVLPNAYPCNLAVSGLAGIPAKFEPEYPLAQYSRTVFDHAENLCKANV